MEKTTVFFRHISSRVILTVKPAKPAAAIQLRLTVAG
jgi:hypothetical protein